MQARHGYDSSFKAKIALEAIKAERTLAELSSQYGVHVNQITRWRKQVLEELPGIFSKKKQAADIEASRKEEELLKQIGQLSVELEWMKKKARQLS